MADYPNVTITCMVEHGGAFLIIKRSMHEDNYPGVWAFPGGKVEIGEDAMATVVREVAEETGLAITDEVAFLNTYCFGRTLGLTFLVRAVSADVRLSEDSDDYRWVRDERELADMDILPGIENHLVRARRALGRGVFASMKDVGLASEWEYKGREKAA